MKGPLLVLLDTGTPTLAETFRRREDMRVLVVDSTSFINSTPTATFNGPTILVDSIMGFDPRPIQHNFIVPLVAPFYEDLSVYAKAKRRSTEAYRQMVRESRESSTAPEAVKARKGWQQFARIPCYRGVRVR